MTRRMHLLLGTMSIVAFSISVACEVGPGESDDRVESTSSALEEAPQYLSRRTPPQFLSTGTGDHEAETRQYYDTWGAPKTLDDFRQAWNFDGPGADVAGAVYYNAGDLHLGREMRCTAKSSGGHACYVRNYGGFTATPQAALHDATRRHNPIATVAMTYEPERGLGVNFVVYDGRGDQLLSLALDTVGVNKAIPFNCINCHGGIYDLPTHKLTQASFLPFDLASFQYASDPGYRRREQENEFRRLNEHVYEVSQALAGTDPNPIGDLIDGWYGGAGNVHRRQARFFDNFVPTGWQQQQSLYENLVRPYCRSCHIAAGPPFDSYDSMFQPNVPTDHFTRTAVRGDLCNHSMPDAEVTFRGFWHSNAPDLLKQELLRLEPNNPFTEATCPTAFP